MKAVAITDPPPRSRGKKPRARALSNEEVWRRLQEECADVHPFVMRWCEGDEGLAWEAMHTVGRTWLPDRGASFRSYVRSWSKHVAYTMLHGNKDRPSGKRTAILTRAQRVFGEDGELTLEDVVPDDERAPEYEADELAELGWALEQLRENQRQVLRARFFEGRTLREIADERESSTEGVRQLQAMGLARARALIEARRKEKQRASSIRRALADIAGGSPHQPAAPKPPDPVAAAAARAAAREHWRTVARERGLTGKALGGFVGGQMRRDWGRANLTADERSARCSQAALKRWGRARCGGERASAQVRMKITPTLKREIEQAASTAGMSVAAWVRAALVAQVEAQRQRAS